jgi:hypothetical protein
MARAAVTGKTRVVVRRRRADTRAATEPRDKVVYDPDAEVELTTERDPMLKKQPRRPTQPERRPRNMQWLGVVVAPPLLGASLVIGTWLRPDFRVTSAITRLIERDDGVIVMTASKSGYLVEHSGDVYFVGKVT